MSFTILVLGWLIYYGLGDRVPTLDIWAATSMVLACLVSASIEYAKAESVSKTASKIRVGKRVS